jgi:predicted Zn-dependent protease
MAKFPENDAIKLEYTSLLLKTGNPEQARKMLFNLNADTQKRPVYTQLLAQVYGNLHQVAESHRYLAEYYYQIGRTQEAILQIRLARNSKGLTPQLDAILSERLKFFYSRERDVAKQ